MDKTEIVKLRKTIFISGLVYIGIAAVILVMTAGFKFVYITGLILGFGAMMLNLILLENVVALFRLPAKRPLAVLIYLLRLAIYGAIAVICYELGTIVLIAFAAGVLALLAGALVYMVKGGKSK